MTTPLQLDARLLSRAALIAVLTVGGLSFGLGLTTYTMAKANDYMHASLTGDTTARSDMKCMME